MSMEKNGDLLDLARMVAASHGGVTLDQICERFGIKHRTAQRWKDRLVAFFPDVEEVAGCDGDRRHRWRMRKPPDGGFADVSADQLAAIDMAVAALGPDTREAVELRGLADEVRSRLPRDKLARLEPDHDALLAAQGLVARPGPRPKVDAAVEAALARALKGSLKVTFDYASENEVAATMRRVIPLGLLSGLRRYLVALPEEPEGKVRTYRLDKVAGLVVLNEAYVRPADFDLQTFAKRGFGAFFSDREYGEVVWRFSPAAAERARGYCFHPDQRIEEGDDGWLTVRFLACGHLEMCWHLYSWGDKVEVIEPKALRDMVAGHRRGDFAGMP